MKKRSERCRHCAPAAVPHRCTESAMAVVRHSQNSPPPQTPFPGAQDRQNLISWRRSPPAPTDPVWWRSMHAISSYRGNRHRPPATNTQTHRQDRLQYTAPLASTQCKYDDDDDRLARYLWQASFAEKRGRSVSVCETWHRRVIIPFRGEHVAVGLLLRLLHVWHKLWHLHRPSVALHFKGLVITTEYARSLPI